MTEEKKGVTYKDAGVDIEANLEANKLVKDHVKKTFNKNVLLDVGLFGGAISAEKLKKFNEPVLVASIDGVGTKLKIAAKLNKWDTVGKDIVNHSADDILCQGAEPFFFLDYIAAEKLNPQQIEQIVKGMSEACLEADLPLIGGETAEMPGVYEKGEIDIAGCIVGVMEKGKVIDGSTIKEGDVVIALPSNGLHTNGYSLARKVMFEVAGFDVNDHLEELGTTVGLALLEPHKGYVKPVLALMKEFEVKGLAHITGGGLIDNVPRVLPDGLGVKIEKSKIKTPAIFKLIQEKGNVPEQDMWHTFNMGVGFVVIVSAEQAETAIAKLKELGEEAYSIGVVESGKGVQLI
jgi:phosphoribosylformylglycinamidine cyclo-ligase